MLLKMGEESINRRKFLQRADSILLSFLIKSFLKQRCWSLKPTLTYRLSVLLLNRLSTRAEDLLQQSWLRRERSKWVILCWQAVVLDILKPCTIKEVIRLMKSALPLQRLFWD